MTNRPIQPAHLLAMYEFHVGVANGKAAPGYNSVCLGDRTSQQEKLKHEHHARTQTDQGRQYTEYALIDAEIIIVKVAIVNGGQSGSTPLLTSEF